MTNLKIGYFTEVIRSTVEEKRGPQKGKGRQKEGISRSTLRYPEGNESLFWGKSNKGIRRASERGESEPPLPFAGQNPLLLTNLKTQRPLLSYA